MKKMTATLLDMLQCNYLLAGFLYIQDVPKINISPSSRQGDFMLAVGSPFGILSPMHFFNRYYIMSLKRNLSLSKTYVGT